MVTGEDKWKESVKNETDICNEIGRPCLILVENISSAQILSTYMEE